MRPTSSRPTNYAKPGRQGQMLVKGCPCITKKKGKKIMDGKTKKPTPKKTPKSPYGKVVQKTTKKTISYSPDGRKV